MVSAKRYFEVFFSVVSERFKKIGELRKRKSDIDNQLVFGKPFNKNSEQKNALAHQLLEIIGEDSFLRRAEKRNKDTLRHLLFKIISSLEKYQEYSERNEFFDKKNKVKPLKSLESVKEFLNQATPWIVGYLRELDEVYKDEARILEDIAAGKKDISAYAEIAKRESGISQNTARIAKQLERHVKTFENVIIAYRNYLESKMSSISEVIASGVAGVFMLSTTLIFFKAGIDFLAAKEHWSSLSYGENIEIGWIAVMFGIVTGTVGSYLLKNTRFIEFKRLMDETMV